MEFNNILLRKGYAKIKLKKINTNHFELKAKLNNVKGRLLKRLELCNHCLK